MRVSSACAREFCGGRGLGVGAGVKGPQGEWEQMWQRQWPTEAAGVSGDMLLVGRSRRLGA